MNKAVPIKEGVQTHPAQVDSQTVLDRDEPVGYILRGERMTMGLEIEDVRNTLKIRPEIIEALEDNDLQSIGRPQFVSGYIRSYARLLKLDPEVVLDAYSEQCGLVRQTSNGSMSKSKHGKKSQSASLHSKQFGNTKRSWRDRFEGFTRTTSLAFPLLVVFLLLGGVIYAAANFVRGFQTLEVVPVESRPAALTENEMPEVTQNMTLAEAESPEINYDELYERQALQTPVVTPRVGRIADVDVNAIGVFAGQGNKVQLTAAESTANNELANQALLSTPKPLSVIGDEVSVDNSGPVVTVGPTIPNIQLIPLGESWVRLTNEDGDVLLEKQLNPGEVVNVPIEGYVPVLRRAGNATELYVRVNGEIFGPISADGSSVVNNIPLTPESIGSTYELISPEMLAQLQEKEQAYVAKAEN